jgi:hypothetical protein
VYGALHGLETIQILRAPTAPPITAPTIASANHTQRRFDRVRFADGRSTCVAGECVASENVGLLGIGVLRVLDVACERLSRRRAVSTCRARCRRLAANAERVEVSPRLIIIL